jgi:hypothetical protein
MELNKHEAPDEYWAFKNRVSDYNKKYYQDNREEILAKRAESRKKS